MIGVVAFRYAGETPRYLRVQNLDEVKEPFGEGFVIQPFKPTAPTMIATGEFTDELAIIPCVNDKQITCTKEEHMEAVKQAQGHIAVNAVSKVVLSRTKLTSAIAQPLQLFEDLCATYPTVFVYLLNLPEMGCWLGATPELLLNKTGQQFLTTSVAGTKLPNEDWTEKELNEQQQVTDFIASNLESMGSNLQIEETTTISAGQIQHLKTDISFTGDYTALQIAKALHPTPAVCGNPRGNALEIINKLEKHDRRLYAGFVGWHSAGQSRFYVNLRCVELHQDSATLYAGGGITEGSNPEQEWKETERKINTLLSVIG